MNETLQATHGGRRFKIEEDPTAGFYVYVFEGEKCTQDYLQDTLTLAKKFVRDKFGVPEDAWRPEHIARMSETFESKRAPEPVGAFPHAKRVGEFLFLSGIGPRKRDSKEIPGVTLDSAGNIKSYNIETQCRAVFENVRLVLEDAGATWNDIVDVTVFLTNMKKDFPVYNKLYAEYFAGAGKPNPTRTTIEVTALPTPIAIELKVIAALKK
jgi:2-aminomuconate deaminase